LLNFSKEGFVVWYFIGVHKTSRNKSKYSNWITLARVMRDTVTVSHITTEVMEPADDVCGSQAPNMFDMRLEIE